MKWFMCSIKDTAIAAFMRPFVVRHRGEALRIFTDEVNRQDSQNPLSQHPKDFELFVVGSFDDELGLVVHCELQRLAAGVDVRLTE